MAIGIIAEYNPFHSGHEFQISELKKLTGGEPVVAVMSGSFTQRGMPTILDKFTRARLAIFGGCDLVLELPFVFAVESAQDFARGGIKILKKLGVINKLAFGAEFPDLSILRTAANFFDDKDFSEKLKKKMSVGISYARATAEILSEYTGIDEKILSRPNNILAIEYLRALPAEILPILIQRFGADYDDGILRENFSSAAAIRNEVYKENPDWKKISASVDSETLAALQKEKIFGLVSKEFLFRPILTKLLTATEKSLKEIYGMTEGLENLMPKVAGTSKNYFEIVAGMTSLRYPASRIERLLLHFLLDLKSCEIDELYSGIFARVLAFNERGKNLLKKISSSSEIPVVTKVTKHLNRRDIYERRRKLSPYQKNLLLDVSASNLREILFEKPKDLFQDFLNSPQFIEKF